MSEYVKWEPVVGQVPPDGCEFILKRNTNSWCVWGASDNRPVNEYDPALFNFRIPAPTKENPVVIKYFTFEERPEAVKEYKTLADVPEGVRCAVTSGTSYQMVRYRNGLNGCDTVGDFIDYASAYTVVQILDPLPAPQLPATMAEAEECRVYVNSDGQQVFKSGEWVYRLRQLTLTSSDHFCEAYFLTSDSYYMEKIRITAATNTYAVSCSQEVK